MNCKQVEDLLPLYVSHDLDNRRESSIAAHLQICLQCNSAAGEYREARQMLQEFAAPAFSDSVYTEIRQSVWRKIETEAVAPSLVDMIAGWFRPRVAWAAATALLIVVSVLGIYLIVNRDLGRNEGLANAPEHRAGPNENTEEQRRPEKLAGVSSDSDEGTQGQRRCQADIHQPERKRDRRRAPDRMSTLAVNVPDPHPSIAGSSNSADSSAESSAIKTTDGGKPTRVEIQTKNPRIRIIWFAQRNAKSGASGLKGT